MIFNHVDFRFDFLRNPVQSGFLFQDDLVAFMDADVMFGFGAMRLDLVDENDQSSVDKSNYQEMIDYYMSQGFNYFDTSYAYHDGSSEIGLREYLVKKYP